MTEEEEKRGREAWERLNGTHPAFDCDFSPLSWSELTEQTKLDWLRAINAPAPSSILSVVTALLLGVVYSILRA